MWCEHTILVDNIGRIWSYGDNTYGQLGRDIAHTTAAECNNNSSTIPSLKKQKSTIKKSIDNYPREVNFDSQSLEGSPGFSKSRSIRWIKVCYFINVHFITKYERCDDSQIVIMM